MDATFDLNCEALRRSLAETIAWCKDQPITANAEETDDVKQRRILGQQGAQLIRRAYLERNRFWNKILRRNCTNTRFWRQGIELGREADLSSIAPLEGQLRTPSFRPSLSLAAARTMVDRNDIVQSLVAKRSEFVRSKSKLLQEQTADMIPGKLLLCAPKSA